MANDNPNGMNTVEARDDFSISELKGKGLSIRIEYEKPFDRNEKEHERVAHYWLIKEVIA